LALVLSLCARLRKKENLKKIEYIGNFLEKKIKLDFTYQRRQKYFSSFLNFSQILIIIVIFLENDFLKNIS